MHGFMYAYIHKKKQVGKLEEKHNRTCFENLFNSLIIQQSGKTNWEELSRQVLRLAGRFCSCSLSRPYVCPAGRRQRRVWDDNLFGNRLGSLAARRTALSFGSELSAARCGALKHSSGLNLCLIKPEQRGWGWGVGGAALRQEGGMRVGMAVDAELKRQPAVLSTL